MRFATSDDMDDASLSLDLDERDEGERVARIAVTNTRAFTRREGDPVITADCRDLASLEGEAGRLRSELDDALGEAAAAFGEKRDEPKADPSPAPHQETGASLRARTAWTVGDVMTPEVRTVDPNEPLAVAVDAMRAEGFRHMVVVRDDEIEGVISDRDVFYGALAWSLGEGRDAYERHLQSTRIKEVMSAQVVQIDPAAPLSKAAALLREHRVSCLPVLTGTRLVGILTEADFVDLFVA